MVRIFKVFVRWFITIIPTFINWPILCKQNSLEKLITVKNRHINIDKVLIIIFHNMSIYINIKVNEAKRKITSTDFPCYSIL